MNLFSKLIHKLQLLYYKFDILKYGNIVCKKKDLIVLGKCYMLGEPKITIKGKCSLYPGVSFQGDGPIEIGDSVAIGKGTSIYAKKGYGVFIGNNIGIGANSYIIDTNHGIELSDVPMMKQNYECQRIVIEDNVWISENCTILKGSYIHQGTVIGAKTLVNCETEENGIYMGIPAKMKRKRSRKDEV